MNDRGMRGRPKAPIVLGDAQLKKLEACTRGRNRSAAQVLRARIVLLCAEGMDNKDVAEHLEVSEQTVSKWRRRFVAYGFEGLADAPRSGTPDRIPDERAGILLERTAKLAPAEAAKWSTRRAGLELGLSAATVSRIRRGAGLQPNDASGPLLDGRQWAEHELGLIGLYLGPPLRAIVVAVAPGQEAPASRESSGNGEPPAADDLQARACLRQGMLLMLLALERITAELGYGRYRGSEFIRFMRSIEADLPPKFEVHALVYSSEGEAAATVNGWLAKQSHLHIQHALSPTWWLVQAEHMLASLIDRLPAPAAHQAAHQLTLLSRHYLVAHAAQRRPFVWSHTTR